jgi:hypothetical protein
LDQPKSQSQSNPKQVQDPSGCSRLLRAEELALALAQRLE